MHVVHIGSARTCIQPPARAIISADTETLFPRARKKGAHTFTHERRKEGENCCYIYSDSETSFGRRLLRDTTKGCERERERERERENVLPSPGVK